MVRYSRLSPRTSFDLLAQHLASPVVRVYDVVADLELDMRRWFDVVEIREVLVH